MTKNPWDSFPFPLSGDQDPTNTYAGVGLVTSEWESVEFNLARLHGTFVEGDPSGASIRDYGKGRIFSDRIRDLQKIGCKYFTQHCNQDLEGGFHAICINATGFSARRNEVAHGLVMEVSGIQFFQEKLKLADLSEKQHLLVPPYHIMRQHEWDGMPSFAYNSAQMHQLASRILSLSDAIVAYRQSL